MKSCCVAAQPGWTHAGPLRTGSLGCTDTQTVQQKKALVFNEVPTSFKMAANLSNLTHAEMRASPWTRLIALPRTGISNHCTLPFNLLVPV